jgi:hypothetical protein
MPCPRVVPSVIGLIGSGRLAITEADPAITSPLPAPSRHSPGRCPVPWRSPWAGPRPFNSRTLAASIDAGRPLYTPAAFALAIPSSWRSFRRFVSNSANTPSISKKHLPAAVPVSIGCSAALSEAPRAFTAGTNDILQVADRPGQPVNPRRHEHVAGPKEVEHDLQLLAALRGPPAALLGADTVAAGDAQCRLLKREVLIRRTDPRVSNDGHGLSPVVSFGSRPCLDTVSKLKNKPC